MKKKVSFIHIADVHLSASPEAGKTIGKVRQKEMWDTFRFVVQQCEEEQTDLLLIAGDLFHRQPLLKELKEVDYLFSELSHTKVVLIAGNHDHIGKNSYYKTFGWSENVFPLFQQARRLSADEWKKCRAEFPEFDTIVYGFSYWSKEIAEPLYDEIEPVGDGKFEILLAHGGDDKHIPIHREALETSTFDYIALGHIHRQQTVVENKAVYAGSLEPTDKNDIGHHGFVRGEITEYGVRTEFVPCSMREYLHIAVKTDKDMTDMAVADKIKAAVLKYGKENIYRIVLKGERDPERVGGFEDLPGIPDNVLDIKDETTPAYDYERLYEENEENLLGKYIQAFSGWQKGSIEEQALYEGVHALLESSDS